MVAVRLVVQWGCTVSQLKGTTRGEKVLEDARALLLLRGTKQPSHTRPPPPPPLNAVACCALSFADWRRRVLY